MKLLVLPFILLIKIYQKTLSIWLGPKCKYHPSCSHYAVDALETHNLAGLPLIAWRLIRCNPFSHGGVDYVSKNYFENYLKNPQFKAKTEHIGAN
jgi:putative membrane protein insertion efficiency factor